MLRTMNVFNAVFQASSAAHLFLQFVMTKAAYYAEAFLAGNFRSDVHNGDHHGPCPGDPHSLLLLLGLAVALTSRQQNAFKHYKTEDPN